MSGGLVSVLTPCYNTGTYIPRLLDSVLAQTYPRIEMIVVDDGSTDNSAEVIRSYAGRFESRGYSLEYVRQENSGQSVAIQNGLHKVKGDYLVWPDSDDFYAAADAIEKMVTALENSSEDVAVVRCWQSLVDEDTLESIAVDGPEASDDSLFDNCLFFQNGFYIQPVSFMARFDAVKKSTGLNIYTCRHGGQNWQLLLPLFWSYKCITLKEALACVLQRSSSHSRGTYHGYESLSAKAACFRDVAIETIRRISDMPEEVRHKYEYKLDCNYLRESMKMAYQNRRRSDYIRHYKAWRSISPSAGLLGNRLAYYSVCLHLEPIWELVCRMKGDS